MFWRKIYSSDEDLLNFGKCHRKFSFLSIFDKIIKYKTRRCVSLYSPSFHQPSASQLLRWRSVGLCWFTHSTQLSTINPFLWFCLSNLVFDSYWQEIEQNKPEKSSACKPSFSEQKQWRWIFLLHKTIILHSFIFPPEMHWMLINSIDCLALLSQ